MAEVFWSDVSDEEISRERKIAKELKTTAWWKKKRSDGVCYYCKNKFPMSEITMDHLIPLVRGGKSIKSNLVPSCKKCNFEKRHSLPTEI
ncbi:MAG: HNH endonuclease [Leptospiraceae bacterium]|nr:HNH endonuclease [Leptospiraceae bacterium]MCK6381533.1 HNH endonuclease [Leptospiraceae bacterium]NUM40672.1 HNH endonuclease [Leptospiraceae bacterium]